MIFDSQNLFSDQQAVTATAPSTNVIDRGATSTPVHGAAALASDLGKGTPIPMLVQVTEDFATLTSLTVSVEVDDNEAFSSAKTVATTGAIAAADLVAGKQFSLNTVPLGTDERYIRLKYTVAGTNATAGKVTAGITMGNQTNT